ncbi:uncharacterized protein B0P05DRAFT_542519 [Gilbertella persicaria]|uniref:uncharacterized protein n=1 Tax=Gilbertella persicaria TaxID=101096 RepID=UPI00221F1EB9|nr:uncharacterized protein B0P05DRAFT_542519 [Gilbertella persicaria]KAI8078100.1 hypothetical protein B0P05DRAFT_542519 [Gilbertella persicaria]
MKHKSTKRGSISWLSFCMICLLFSVHDSFVCIPNHVYFVATCYGVKKISCHDVSKEWFELMNVALFVVTVSFKNALCFMQIYQNV